MKPLKNFLETLFEVFIQRFLFQFAFSFWLKDLVNVSGHACINGRVTGRLWF